MSDDDFTVPYGYCHCGCGQETNLIPKSNRGLGRVKGKPYRYVHGHAKRPHAAEIDRYRQEWTRRYPDIPYGHCACGCGRKTTVADETSRAQGWIKGEPRRYISGHNMNRKVPTTPAQYREQWAESTDTPYGFCWCGCGQKTQLAEQGFTKLGHVKGEPVFYLLGHVSTTWLVEHGHNYRRRWETLRPDIPYGFCWCGCGEQTSISNHTIAAIGTVHGEPVRYRSGHYAAAAHRTSVKDYKVRWAFEASDIPYGYCQCGCGAATGLASKTGRNLVKGEPTRFLKGHRDVGRFRKVTGSAHKAEGQSFHAENESRRSLLDRRRARPDKRRLWKRGFGVIAVVDIRQMYDDQDGLCAYCEIELDGCYHIEHMTPLCRGGFHDIENVAIACPECNLRKGAKTAEEYAAELLICS